MATWRRHDPAAEVLFANLRALGPSELRAHLALEIGSGSRVGIPAVSLTLRGRLTVHPTADRLTLDAGVGEVRLGRRMARGGAPAYWQLYVEQPGGVVLSLTAPCDALTLETRPASGEG